LDIAHAVGSSGGVTGIDVSDSMLAMAQNRCVDQPWVEFREIDATQLPFEDSEYDAAVVTQVYEYIADIESALAELYRVLRPGGRALILDTDWESLVLHTSDPDRSNRILAAWDQHLVDPILPRTLIPKLRRAGFELTHSTVMPMYNPDYDPDTYSYGWITLVVSFVSRWSDVTKEEAKAWAQDLRQLGERGEYFFSLNRYLFLVEKPEDNE
jgi:ubiquinone/menaquinone biosynthesis C-methylase UbiE